MRLSSTHSSTVLSCDKDSDESKIGKVKHSDSAIISPSSQLLIPIVNGYFPVLSVRPKVAELAFHVFSRSLHPELYTIHKSRRIERSAYEAQIDITNCGHVITWTSGGVILCEVATSAHQPLPKRRCLLSKPLKGSRTERAKCRGDVGYRTHFQLEPVEPELFRMVQKQLGQGPTAGLMHTFDASGRMALGALSYINVEARRRSMLVQAIHTFPDDYAIVKVESLFSLAPETETV
ncbi:MAG: DUF2617 family protein [Planctomycetota bacterium]